MSGEEIDRSQVCNCLQKPSCVCGHSREEGLRHQNRLGQVFLFFLSNDIFYARNESLKVIGPRSNDWIALFVAQSLMFVPFQTSWDFDAEVKSDLKTAVCYSSPDLFQIISSKMFRLSCVAKMVQNSCFFLPFVFAFDFVFVHLDLFALWCNNVLIWCNPANNLNNA